MTPEVKAQFEQYDKQFETANNPAYERGFIDGMQKQMQSSVDKAVNAMAQKWVGLTDEPVGKFAKFTDGIWREVTAGSAGVPLFEHPKEWVGLTEEELYEIYDASDEGSSPCGVCGACSKCKIEVSIARAIEAKLKQKNR